MFVLIEISQGIKFFCFKIFIRKTISNFLLFLEQLYEKIESQNIILHLPKTYANSFAKEIITKKIYIKSLQK
jgi:hypothetical protein